MDSLNSLQTDFNHLLVNYPQLEQFCTDIRDAGITTDILANERIRLQNTLKTKTAEKQCKKMLTLAEKFKQIVIEVDNNQDSLLVAEKITKLVNKFKFSDSPIVNQMESFLNVFSKSLYLKKWEEITREFKVIKLIKKFGENPLSNDPHIRLLKAVLEIFGGWRVLIDKYSKFTEELAVIFKIAEYEDQQYIWDQLIVRNDKEIEFLLLTKEVMNYKSRKILIEKYSDNPEALAVIFQISEYQEQQNIWDQLITPHNHEIKLLSHLKNAGVKTFLKFKSKKSLIEKYSEDPKALAVIFSMIGYEITEQSYIWDELIVRKNLEIKFLSHLQNQDIYQFFDHYHYHNKIDLIANLIEKYKNKPKALAVIFRFAFSDAKRHYIWNSLIAPKNRELKFLSQVDLPGAIVGHDLYDNLPPQQSVIAKNLIERYKKNGIALAQISKLLEYDQKKKLWDKIVVPNNLEIEFLSILSTHQFEYFYSILRTKSSNNEKPSRIKNLIEKYKQDVIALGVISDFYSHHGKFWDEIIEANNLEIEFLSSLPPRRGKRFRIELERKRKAKLIEKYQENLEALTFINQFFQKKFPTEA